MRPLLLALLALGCSNPPALVSDAGAPPIEDAGGPSDAGPAMEPPEAIAVTVASWNIEHFPRDARTVHEVARLIEEQGLDLVGVQEITDRDAFEALDEALPEHDAVVSFRGWQRVGFLYRADRFRVSDIDLLFSDDWWSFPRPVLSAHVALLDDDGEAVLDFDFLVLHLKAQIDDESRSRREAAVRELEAWMRVRAEVEPEILVVGDFNDELLDPPEENVYRPLLYAPDRYAFLTLPNEREGEYSYLTFRAMIDHVLVTTPLAPLTTDTRVLRIDHDMGSYRELVSDHVPVVTTLRVP